ncbi:Zn(II)2Cys6 transcription factor domain-containing protein [Rhodotorula paludigena]|uniref:Zn(II)2Cys6 transcription factor domain-containing protein n=1 Tax=Rhodotorula paludigena TaxID=86838 RepID=UPI0031791AC0
MPNSSEQRTNTFRGPLARASALWNAFPVPVPPSTGRRSSVASSASSASGSRSSRSDAGAFAPSRAVSCEGCRARKLRCSRTKNCSKCKARGIPCIWAAGNAPSRSEEEATLEEKEREIRRLNCLVDRLKLRVRELGGTEDDAAEDDHEARDEPGPLVTAVGKMEIDADGDASALTSPSVMSLDRRVSLSSSFADYMDYPIHSSASSMTASSSGYLSSRSGGSSDAASAYSRHSSIAPRPFPPPPASLVQQDAPTSPALGPSYPSIVIPAQLSFSPGPSPPSASQPSYSFPSASPSSSSSSSYAHPFTLRALAAPPAASTHSPGPTPPPAPTAYEPHSPLFDLLVTGIDPASLVLSAAAAAAAGRASPAEGRPKTAP